MRSAQFGNGRESNATEMFMTAHYVNLDVDAEETSIFLNDITYPVCTTHGMHFRDIVERHNVDYEDLHRQGVALVLAEPSENG